MIIRDEYLIKLNAKNRIQQVRLQLDQNNFTNIYSIYRTCNQFGGKEIEQPIIFIEFGKVKRTVSEQATLQYNSLLNNYLNAGYKLFSLLSKQNYKSLTEEQLKSLLDCSSVTDTFGVPKPMLAKSSNQMSSTIFERRWLCSKKLDGVRCLMYYKDGMILTASRGGGTYNASTKHIRENEKLKALFREFPDLILDGELYKHSVDYPLQVLSGLARQETWKPECEALEYWIFDYISPEPFKKRLETIEGLQYFFKDEEKIKVIEHISISGYSSIKRQHDKWVSEGFEGLCMRNPDKEYGIGKRSGVYLVKVKEYEDAEYQIIGVKEGLRPEDMCFVLITEDGKEFAAKPMGTVETRIEYLTHKDFYIGKMATCKYFTLSKDGIPTQPILKNIRFDGE